MSLAIYLLVPAIPLLTKILITQVGAFGQVRGIIRYSDGQYLGTLKFPNRVARSFFATKDTLVYYKGKLCFTEKDKIYTLSQGKFTRIQVQSIIPVFCDSQLKGI